MTQPLVSASGLVRITVASGSRSVDLVLPGSVPVAELVPELARSVGLLDAVTVHAGYRLVTAAGRELAGDLGLVGQGVYDGGLLTVTAGIDDQPPRAYDDVVEAMADVVEQELRPWDPATGRGLALAAATLLMVLGALVLLSQRGATLAGATASVAAVALVGGAVVLSRVQHEAGGGVAVAWLGSAYAAVAGLLLVTGDGFHGLPLAGAGAGALVAGLVALVGLAEGRTLVLPPVVVGAVFLVAGLVTDAFAVDLAVALTTTLTLAVLGGSVLPRLALGVTGTSVDQLLTVRDIDADPAEIDRVRVSADARLAHEVLVAVSATVGLLLVLVVPLIVSLGIAGTLLAAVACLVVMLRTRQLRSGTEALVGLVSGLLGLASLAVSLVWLHPGWRLTEAVVLAATGAVLLALTLVPAPRRYAAGGWWTSPSPSAWWRCSRCSSWPSASSPRSAAECDGQQT